MPDTPTPTPIHESPSSELDPTLAAAQAEIAGLKASLEEAHKTIDVAERARLIERELAGAGAIDTEVASLLTELAVRTMKTPDIALAVRDLKKRKPFLFARNARAAASSTMSPALRSSTDGAAAAAQEARATGDRRALLRYLRARREHTTT